MLKMVDGTGIIGVDMVCPLGGAVSPPQPPNYDNIEMEGVGSLMLPNSLKAPLERLELIGNSAQGENPAPDNPQEIKSAGKWNEGTQKYEIDVKVTGKNLFNAEKARDIANWIVRDGDGYAKFPIRAGKGNKVIFSYTEKLTAGKGFFLGIARSDTGSAVGWLYHSTEINLISNKFTVVAQGDFLYLSCNKSGLKAFWDTVKTLQVEMGSEQTVYEPYTEQSVQITLDEPLRGIGEYKDTITKDGAVRKIAPYEVNLNDLRDGGYSKTNTVMFSVKVQNKTVGYASSKPSILCNILPDCALQMSNIYNNDKECIAVGGGIVLFRVNKSRLKDISSFEATKQSFIELMADKKMIVEYALETPVTEPLPESAQQQLQALHSENGVTHVFVDSGEVPCGIKLTYRKEI